MLRKALYKIYWKLESVIAPGLKYSQYFYEDVLYENCKENVKWLELGCGHSILPKWRHEQEVELVRRAALIVGIDADYPSLTKHATIKHKVLGDITNLPFADSSFDLITSNMVFEHLDKPEKQLREIFRVLSPEGKLIFHTPNKWGYVTIAARIIPEALKKWAILFLEGRQEEDVFSTYYKINSPSKIKELARSTGFNVSQIKHVCSSAQFAAIPPIVIFELLWIRFLMHNFGKPLRTNIIAILEKP